MTTGLVASIHARLLNLAKARGEDFNLILTRYAVERFLYRLSQAPARESYWLKGAMLFDLWFDVPHRATRDADFLGFGSADAKTLATTIRDICVMPADDGMEYDPASISVEEIREDARYGGLLAECGQGRRVKSPDALVKSLIFLIQPCAGLCRKSQRTSLSVFIFIL